MWWGIVSLKSYLLNSPHQIGVLLELEILKSSVFNRIETMKSQKFFEVKKNGTKGFWNRKNISTKNILQCAFLLLIRELDPQILEVK